VHERGRIRRRSVSQWIERSRINHTEQNVKNRQKLSLRPSVNKVSMCRTCLDLNAFNIVFVRETCLGLQHVLNMAAMYAVGMDDLYCPTHPVPMSM